MARSEGTELGLHPAAFLHGQGEGATHLCAGRSKSRGELLPLHCKFFEGELIHSRVSGISCSLNTFLFPVLPVQQAQRHKGDECGTGRFFLWLTC